MLSILFGLTSALSWGAGDFTGGLVSRRVGAVRTTLYVEGVGLLPLFVAAVLSGQILGLSLLDWFWCAMAGAIGSLGVVALYRALSDGRMSVAAPVAALTSASLPVMVGGLRDGLPPAMTLVGFGLALLATWLISQSGHSRDSDPVRFKDLGLPLLAGLGMGSYFILVNQGSQTSIWAPLLAVRAAGTLTLIIFSSFTGDLRFPGRANWPLVLINTTFDIGGSVFFILAGQNGRMDIAAILGSLYAGATVLLAWAFLHEKVSQRQWAGVVMTLLAIICMSNPGTSTG